LTRIDRRAFLTSTLACTCAACPLAALARDSEPDAKAAEPLDVGTLDDYPRDAVYDKYAASDGFFLVRRKGKLYALGSACTHRRTLLKVKDNAFACPKHGARFDLTGAVTKAPAKKPLRRYAIARDDAGRLTVDPSRAFEKGKRDEPASFVAVE
jgi:cytochrome b6-f complex iron-sulfur subunit